MKKQCPKCKATISSSNINLQKNFVYCALCKEIFDSRACLDLDEYDESIINNPPDGTWIKKDGKNTTVGASIPFPEIFGILPLIVALFLPFILMSILFTNNELRYSLLGVNLFILVATTYASLFVLVKYGKYEITSDSQNLSFFMGVGNYGFKKNTELNKIHFIREEFRFFPVEAAAIWKISCGIVLEGQIRIIFGEYFLNDDQRRFILMSLLKIKYA
jgi:hypothetical protein